MDLVTGVEGYLKSGLLPLYYFITIIGAFYVLNKFCFKPLAIFVVLLFWEGLFSYVETSFPFLGNIYKIAYFVFALILFYKGLFLKKSPKETLLNIIFISLMTVFVLSALLNNMSLFLSASQILKKYGVPFLFYYGMKRELHNKFKEKWITNLFSLVVGMQIMFVFLKLILFGFGESLVGSISFIGGGPSNILPVLGFFLIWIRKNGMLNKKDWVFVLGLIILAAIGNKRSVVFILPLVIACTFIFVQKSVKIILIIKYIPIAILILVIGVKGNPTLNPEKSRWGSFDMKYIIDYSIYQVFGSEESRRLGFAVGRGDGFINYMNKIAPKISSNELFFGQGFKNVFLSSYKDFNNERYGVTSKGAVGAALQNIISVGLVGAFLVYLFGMSIVSTVYNKNLRWIFWIFITWDYFLFYNSTIIINAMAILLITNIFLFNRAEGFNRNSFARQRRQFYSRQT